MAERYKRPVPCVGVLIADNQMRVLLVKRKYEPFTGSWCLPSGFMEVNENAEQCAIREAREETGLIVMPGVPPRIYSIFDDPRYDQILLILFPSSIRGGSLCAGDDAQDVRFFDRKDLPILSCGIHELAIREWLKEE